MPIALKKFNVAWLDKEFDDVPLYEWLESTGDVHRARCTLCDKKFDISATGFRQVKSHHKGKNHKSKFDSRFKIKDWIFHGEVMDTDEVLSLSLEEQVARAERIWARYAVESNFTFECASEFADLFPHMFTDSAIAAGMRLTQEVFEEAKREKERFRRESRLGKENVSVRRELNDSESDF